jgi:hypothetical protein
LTHIYWGALFAKLFGFSFITLRFSTLPLAAGSAALCYLIGRSANLDPAGSIFSALLLGLSPLFLPLALSFMTDVPAIFYTLLSLYALIRAGQSRTIRSSLIWLGIGVVSGIIGGMGRQTVWVAPLSVIPYLIFIRRREAWFVAAAIAGWLLVLADVYLSLRWFKRQPWVYLDPPLLECLRQGLHHPRISFTNLVMVCFTIVMVILPAVIPFILGSLVRFWRLRKTWRGGCAAVVILALSAGMIFHPAFGMAPWLYNTICNTGVLDGLELSGHRPIVLPLAILGCISALVLLACYLFMAWIVELLIQAREIAANIRAIIEFPPVAILTIFGSVYFSLLIVRSAQDLVFDRYCLPLIPCVVILLVRRWRPNLLAWAALGVFIFYAMASTQDNLALAAARLAAIDRLRSSGVPGTEIAGGFEYDFYVQLQEKGHINRYGISNAVNSFDPSKGFTPALKCRYRLEYAVAADTTASRFGTIEYTSWLPPFHRSIYIDQFKNPWWLDARRSGKMPEPMSYETSYEQ